MFLFRKCLVVFPSIQETNEDIIAKMNEIEYELVESAELTITDEQVGHSLLQLIFRFLDSELIKSKNPTLKLLSAGFRRFNLSNFKLGLCCIYSHFYFLLSEIIGGNFISNVCFIFTVKNLRNVWKMP